MNDSSKPTLTEALDLLRDGALTLVRIVSVPFVFLVFLLTQAALPALLIYVAYLAYQHIAN